jgi:hypothetical protein
MYQDDNGAGMTLTALVMPAKAGIQLAILNLH